MTNKEAEYRIEQAYKSGSSSLDLSNLQLSELPDKIGELKNLKKLDLRYNQFSFIPDTVFQLSGLEKLVVSNNKIHTLPSDIKKLENLKILHIEFNQIQYLPDELGGLKYLESIEAEENQLSEFPSFVIEIPNLKTLKLRHNRITKIPKKIGKLRNIKYMSLGGNYISVIPKEIKELKTIRILHFADNQIQSFIHEICDLSELTHLYLSRNTITEIPSEIENLKKLKILALDENQIYELPKGLLNLHELQEFDIRDNSIELPTNITDSIKEPQKIFKYFFKNRIPLKPVIERKQKKIEIRDTVLSDDKLLQIFKQAKEYSINTLILINNNLKTLPPSIGELTNLTSLDLGQNNLEVLPYEIGNLVSLRRLSLNNNRLTCLPKEIVNLRKLSWIFCRNNYISSLPSEIGNISSLKGLYVENNLLSELPRSFMGIKTLERLNIEGNEFSIPPEIIKYERQPEKILNYYFSLETELKKPISEAKMLIVGQGSVGKTSLLKRLTDNKFNPHESKTDGINIERWHVPHNDNQVQLNIWDFGGQEIMHATHQFFLTKRSLYILVLDSRVDEQENRLEYWLKIINSFGGDSPVIIVCNKSDQHAIDLNWKGLRKKYPLIKTFAKRVSCKTGEGIPELKNLIEKEVTRLDHINDELILSWFSVKEQLEKTDKDYISYREYREICKKSDIFDDLSQQTLIGFLHDLGVVLHFQDHPVLEDTNVLNPEWVTKGVYQILNSHILFQKKGELDRKDLGQILDPQVYPKNRHQFIIDMMRNFELCFDFEGYAGQKFLVPDLLSKEEPDTGEWKDSLAFQYHYDILPGSIISRFIVRMQAFISKRTFWRNGVVLVSDDKKNRALVKADIEDRKILVCVSGIQRGRRTFLAIIRADFRKIHATIPKIRVREKVPVPKAPDVVIDYLHLLRLEEKNMRHYLPEGLDDEIDVAELLNGVEAVENRRDDDKGGRHIYNIHTEKVTIGDEIDINSGGDMSFAKDRGISVIENKSITESVSHQMLLEAGLKNLSSSVQNMLRDIPEERSEEIMSDLETFRKETGKKKPRRKWYELSAEGLMETAQNLGIAGKPVIERIHEILKILDKNE